MFKNVLSKPEKEESDEALLEVVRLEEFAVVQQVSQMGHKPPVVQRNTKESRFHKTVK